MATFEKKTWADRVSEYPTRRTLTHSDNSTEVVTVSRTEGQITNPGDAFNAQNMNDLEGRIDASIDSVNSDMTTMQQTFQAGVDTIYNAIRTNGVTPSSSTPTACATAIGQIRSGGNAAAAHILETKNAYVNKALVAGTMKNYSGNNRRTVTPAAGRNTQNLSIAPGYHDSVAVNTATVYDNAKQVGINEAHAYSWNNSGYLTISVSPHATHADRYNYSVSIRIPCDSIETITGTASGLPMYYPQITFYTSAGASISTSSLGGNTAITVPSNASYAIITKGATDTTLPSNLTLMPFTAKYRAQKLH